MRTKKSAKQLVVKRFFGGMDGFADYFKLTCNYDTNLFKLQFALFDSWLEEDNKIDSNIIDNINNAIINNNQTENSVSILTSDNIDYQKENKEPQLKKQKVMMIADNNVDLNFSLKNLPNEIICEILNFLQLKEIFLNISKLNKYFRNFINNWNYIESKYKTENIFNFILMDSFKNLLTTPELKYVILIKPSLSINLSIEILKKSNNIVVIKEDNKELQKWEKNNNKSFKYTIYEPNIESLINFVNLIHNIYGYQEPPVLQQLLSKTQLISSFETYFKSIIDISYFKRVDNKNEWLQLFTQLTTILNKNTIIYKKDEKEPILFKNLLWNNINLYPYLVWEMKFIPFGYYDRAGHGDGGMGIFTVRTDIKDLRNYASVVFIDSNELMCAAPKVKFHQFIEFLVKEINEEAEENWW
ncbi:hypothetical protein ABK040_002766 [Willaertia magna]